MSESRKSVTEIGGEKVALPALAEADGLPVEKALQSRRSVRDFNGEALDLGQISHLLWAAQGITSPEGFRTAPSAGALYPLEIYVVAGDVSDLRDGVYVYGPDEHTLHLIAEGDRRRQLARAALSQHWIASSAAIIVMAGVFRRTTKKYGRRGLRYVHMEAGHAAQNVYLQAVSLGLGTTTVGAFDDARLKAVLDMPEDADPLCLLPVGRIS